MVVHVLNQFIWPDAAPTGLYAEQLAVALAARGREVVVVGGRGTYRDSSRPRPAVRIERIDHWVGDRARLMTVLAEYVSVSRAYARYIRERVKPGDVVVVTSAPPTTIGLAADIQRRGAVAVYWLQDYYPELVRALVEPPRLGRLAMARYFDSALRRWDIVVKAAGNLGYAGSNARVIRNWPTLAFPQEIAPTPRTALYSGNLGYGHDPAALVEACNDLRDQGYQVTVRGDGPGLRALPSWIDIQPPLRDDVVLARSYQAAEVHLVAGHPRIQRAVFPSKIWNSLAASRRIIATGFRGEARTELDLALSADYASHLPAWTALVERIS